MKLFIFFLLLSPFALYGQKIVRSSIGTSGHTTYKSDLIIQSTIGQPALITHEKLTQNTGIRQGFIQPTSFEIQENDLDIKLYPNPNSGVFFFDIGVDPNEAFKFYIFDQNGKVILSDERKSQRLVKVELPDAESGIYFLQVQNNQKKSIVKFNIIP